MVFVKSLVKRGFRQTHQGERWQTIGHVYFDADGRGFDADLGAAVDDGEGHAHSLKGRTASCGFSRVDEVGSSGTREVLQNVSAE